MTFLLGAGGMMKPLRRYFSVSCSWSPRKSLKRLNTVDCRRLNFETLVFVVTLANEIRIDY